MTKYGNTMYKLLHSATPLSFIEEKIRTCMQCGSAKTSVNKNKRKDGTFGYYPEWYKNGRGYICVNCYHKKQHKQTILNAALKLGYVTQVEVMN